MQDGLQVGVVDVARGVVDGVAGAGKAAGKAAGRWLNRLRNPSTANEDVPDDAIKIQIHFSSKADNWPLMVSPSDNIGDVKKVIYSEHYIPSDQQILYTIPAPDGNDKQLSDHHTLQHYNIKENDILYLKLKDRKCDWTIFVHYKGGVEVPVGVNADDTLDLVRAIIFDQDVKIVDAQEKEYEYNKSLAELNIKNGQVIYAQNQTPKKDLPVPLFTSGTLPNQNDDDSSSEDIIFKPRNKPPLLVDQRRDGNRREGGKEIDSDDSDDEIEKLQELHETLKKPSPPIDGGPAYQRPYGKRTVGPSSNDTTSKSHGQHPPKPKEPDISNGSEGNDASHRNPITGRRVSHSQEGTGDSSADESRFSGRSKRSASSLLNSSFAKETVTLVIKRLGLNDKATREKILEKIEQMNQEIQGQMKVIELLTEEKRQLNADLFDKNEKMRELKESNEKLQSQAAMSTDTSKKALGVAEVENLALQGDIHLLKRTIEEQKNENIRIKQAMQKISDANLKTINQLDEDVKKKKQENVHIKQENQEHKLNIQTLKDEKKQLEQDYKRITGELLTCRQELARVQQQHQRIAGNDSTRDQQTKSEQHIAKLERDIKEREDMIRQLRDDLKKQQRSNVGAGNESAPVFASSSARHAVSQRASDRRPNPDGGDDYPGEGSNGNQSHHVDGEDSVTTVHVMHLFTRLNALLGPDTRLPELVDALSYQIRRYIKRSKRRALMKKMLPSYAEHELPISGDEFQQWVLQYLLSSNTDRVQSMMDELRLLHEDGY